MLEKSYWNQTGTYQEYSSTLRDLIPPSGGVPEGNPKLEILRQHINCYYDLYNNGLCNRANEFRQLFKIASSKHKKNSFYSDEMLMKVEDRMDVVILEAAKEQGIHI